MRRSSGRRSNSSSSDTGGAEPMSGASATDHNDTADSSQSPSPAAGVKLEMDDGDSDSTAHPTMQTAAEATAAARMPITTPSLLHAASLILPNSSIMQQHKISGVGNLGIVSAPTGIARFATMPHGGGGGMISHVAPLPIVSGFVASGAVGAASPPSSFSRQVSRLPSGGGVGSGAGINSGAANGAAGDWRALVSVEERITIRRKLRESYLRHCPTYQELIDTATAVDEELLFACSTNRIDFFKSSIDWDTRIQIKCQQLKTGSSGGAAAVAASNGTGGMGAKKRSFEDAAAGNLSATSTSLLAEIGFNNSDLLGASGGPNGSNNAAALASLAPPASSTSSAAAAAASNSSSLLQIPTMSQLRGAALPAASLPATKDMANLLVAVAADAQPNKKQRS